MGDSDEINSNKVIDFLDGYIMFVNSYDPSHEDVCNQIYAVGSYSTDQISLHGWFRDKLTESCMTSSCEPT